MSIVDRILGLKTSVAIKAPCRVATTANITLNGLQTIDAVSVAAGDRVLVKDQSDASENGIYDASAGAWTRAVDFNASTEIVNGTEVLSVFGTANGGRRWYVSTASPAIGSALAFSQVTTPASGAEPSDGDKGDITVSSSGLSWVINAAAVVTSKIADSAITSAKIASNAVTIAKIQDTAVTLAKIQNIQESRLLGRVSSGAGAPEELTAAQVLSLLGLGGSGYTSGAAVATTSGQTINLATGLSGVSEFSVFFQNVGLSGATDSVLVQLGTSGGFVTTGYVSESAFGTAVAPDTGGFLSRLLGSSREMIGEMRFTHMGGNLWRSSHATNYGHGGGYVTLPDALTQVRLQVSGTPTDSFDNGSAQVAYKT